MINIYIVVTMVCCHSVRIIPNIHEIYTFAIGDDNSVRVLIVVTILNASCVVLAKLDTVGDQGLSPDAQHLLLLQVLRLPLLLQIQKVNVLPTTKSRKLTNTCNGGAVRLQDKTFEKF